MLTAQTSSAKKALDRGLLRDLTFAVQEFNSDYADALDRGDIEAWPAYFTEDGIYRLIARDTVEEKVLQLQKTKRDLADAILSEDNSLIRDLRSEDLELLLS